jgi:hypothetical protein
MESRSINTRADLDSLAGTQAHADFIALLKGSMTTRTNVAVYPEGYGEAGYEGPAIDPVWEDGEDLRSIERFGFTKAEIVGL